MKTTKKIIDNRIFFLDLLKAISIATVVFFHASSNLSESIKHQLEILQSPFRFCVPVLLTISFFLLNRSLERNYEQPNWFVFRKKFVRLLLPTLFWFGFATLITLFLNVIYDQNLHLKKVIVLNLQGQIFWGGYFLILLLQCLPIFMVFNHYLNPLKNIFQAICFQSIISEGATSAFKIYTG